VVPGPHDIVAVVGTERDEQVARLVVVLVVLVDDGDRPVTPLKTVPQLVCGHRPGCPGTQHEQLPHRRLRIDLRRSRR
jgi:hypothetical protein